jgi:tRNA-specific 2-thiouridylase
MCSVGVDCLPEATPTGDPEPAQVRGVVAAASRLLIFLDMMDLAIGERPAASRVVVAMSGGVDSSTTAAMLVRAGYDVVGITLHLYDAGAQGGRERSCCAGRDALDARRVADHLGIPHYVLDYADRFRAQVMEPFADSYRSGETPIPCVLCNETVKFTDLLGVAHDLGADALVTGHYARWRRGDDGPELHQALEERRDQTYFLFSTTTVQLDAVRFPLGEISKERVRALAREWGLPVADKADSQDICFVSGDHYGHVVERLRPEACEPGDIVDLDGRMLGRHRGVGLFTIGQRRGLGLSASEPLHVVRLEPERRRVVVGPRSALGRCRFHLRSVNWLGRTPLSEAGDRLTVKVRSTRPAVPATVRARPGNAAEVVLDDPEEAIAPGQACVFYRDGRVLGGGWIRRDPPLG